MISLIVFTLISTAQADPKPHPWKLRPFTSDNCTFIPDGTKEEPKKWVHCCQTHDLAYWAGGSFSERQDADLAFKKCLEDVGEKTLAFFGYLGLRLSGTALLPTPFRWAYGWTGVRGYWALTPEEKLEVQRLSSPNTSTARVSNTSKY